MSNKTDAPKKSFFKGIKAECKKINWPSKSVVAKESGVVFVITVILSAIIFAVDWIIQSGLEKFLNL